MESPLTTFEDWLKVHRDLMRQEALLAAIAGRLLRGEADAAELSSAYETVLGLRALGEAVMDKALADLGR